MISIWGQIQNILEKSLNPGLFKVWISPLAAEVRDDVLRLVAPNEFVAAWVRDRLLDDIVQAATAVLGSAPTVVVDAAPHGAGTLSPRMGRAGASVSGTAPSADGTQSVPAAQISPAVQAVAVRSASGTGARVVQPSQLGLPLDMPAPNRALNWRFSFDSFVVGPNNELAYAASRGICRETLSADTLFLSSGPGLGKTHLMQAVGSALCEASNRAAPRVEYLTAEEFATRLIAALKAREVDRFKARYRDVDVLLLEDVHFLQGKERMQDEVLATVKALKSRGSRVVLSSSFAARDLKNLDTQLVSRFCSGFLAHIDKPGFETRRRILCEKARLHQVMLPDNVTDLLADRIRTDVRQIESCLHNLVLKAKLLNRQISMEMAWEVLGHYAQQEVVMDFEGIVRKVCEGFGISPKQLNSRSRKREYVVARNSVFYLARKHTDLSLKEIGDRFSRRHSTVLKGITSIEREMSRETPLGRQVTNTLSLIERNGRITYP
ncbi:chromosomal replication initiator protein DnaA [Desulfovibrio oxamicus]|uniref:Chromosomal replication initiator protein DnaA n=1 Tax=Nitratidesulfovibrio oxamicus TaxID=32016 RepID=A0ABS0J1J4_9BACT|nr:chromosomal replication initiator protein DnaA [Nitratidesulfovibrio oxamicus]MBG3876309.1 chromosomal replication initiator protein DnaA [Nitratidesulfovibrio oxamicus]